MTREEAYRRLSDLAERWTDTSEWHPDFHDGLIKIDTGDLHAIAQLFPELRRPPSHPQNRKAAR